MEETIINEILVKEIKADDKNNLKDFINLPFEIYKDDDAWVPPIKSEFKKYINGIDNYLNEAGPNTKIVAYCNNKCVGRMLIGINNDLNEAKQRNEGYISLFEAIDNDDVAFHLLNFAEEWFLHKGIELIKGPLSLPGGDDNRGFLIDNFKDDTLIMNTYNKKYYNDMFLKFGFEKYLDCYAYKNEIDNENIQRYMQLVPYAMKRYSFHLNRLDLNNIDKEMKDVQQIIDKAMPEEWDDFIPPSKKEIELIAKQLVPYADVDLIYIARTDEGEPIGFNITLPDYNQVLKKINGNLFPFGIFKYFYYKKKINRLRFFVLFVIPEYRKKGVSAAIYLESYKKAMEKNYIFGEGSTIWEYNSEMINDIEKYGGELYKTYRIYQKRIKI